MKEELSAVVLVVLLAAAAAAAQETPPMKWRNPPAKWSTTGGTVAFDVPPKTDYWRTTHYGYVRDTGPFYFREETEFVNGRQNVSTVVTREFSDWSVVPLSTPPRAIGLELVRKADYVETKYSLDGTTWVTVREAYFPPGTRVQIGVMAAAPEGKGFAVRFESFSVTAVRP